MKSFCCSNKGLTKEFADMANFLRMIGEENRLKILCLLKDREKCVCEIVESLNLSQSLVSAHLKALKDMGIVENRKEWKNVYYFVNKKTFKRYSSLLSDFLKKYE